MHDFLLSMTLAGHFKKFPNLRIASVENGAEFLPDLFRKLRSQDKKMPGYFGEDPVEQFRRHVWINPFWEDDLETVVSLMGADRVIFGSDWPHIEALPHPLDYLPETKPLSPADRRLGAPRQRRGPRDSRRCCDLTPLGVSSPWASGAGQRRPPACQNSHVLSKPRRGQQLRASPPLSSGRCSKPIPSHGA